MNQNREKLQASERKPEADADPEIARRLIEVREALHRSQEECAEQMGVSRSAYQRYEAGVRSPKLRQLRGLAELGVNVHWLLTGEGEMLQGAPVSAAQAAAPQGAPTDPDLMGRVIDTIRAVYKAQGQAIPDRSLGEMAARWYDDIVANAADAGDRLDRLAERQIALRKELRTAACDPASGKRRA